MLDGQHDMDAKLNIHTAWERMQAWSMMIGQADHIDPSQISRALKKHLPKSWKAMSCGFVREVNIKGESLTCFGISRTIICIHNEPRNIPALA